MATQVTFDEMPKPLGQQVIPESEASLIAIAMATARQDVALLPDLFRYAFQQGTSGDDIQEILLQTHLFAGVPVVINAFQCFRTYCQEHDIQIPRTQHVDARRSDLRRRGRQAFDIIYEEKADDIISSIADAHEEFAEFIICDAYGRILSRDRLTLRLRELSVVNVLLSLSIMRQMVGHMRGAQRCGATPDEVKAALALAEPYVGPEALAHALELFQRAGKAKQPQVPPSII